MKLTDVAVKNAKTGPRIIRMADGWGLSLEIPPPEPSTGGFATG